MINKVQFHRWRVAKIVKEKNNNRIVFFGDVFYGLCVR